MRSAPTLVSRACTCELQSAGFVTIVILNASSTPSCTWAGSCNSQLQLGMAIRTERYYNGVAFQARSSGVRWTPAFHGAAR